MCFWRLFRCNCCAKPFAFILLVNVICSEPRHKRACVRMCVLISAIDWCCLCQSLRASIGIVAARRFRCKRTLRSASPSKCHLCTLLRFIFSIFHLKHLFIWSLLRLPAQITRPQHDQSQQNTKKTAAALANQLNKNQQYHLGDAITYLLLLPIEFAFRFGGIECHFLEIIGIPRKYLHGDRANDQKVISFICKSHFSMICHESAVMLLMCTLLRHQTCRDRKKCTICICARLRDKKTKRLIVINCNRQLNGRSCWGSWHSVKSIRP